MLISPSTLVVAWQNFRPDLERVAAALPDDMSEKFMLAAQNENTQMLDDLVLRAIQKYTGSGNAIYGLNSYCDKFGIHVDDPGALIPALLRIIAAHADKIDSILSEKGL